MIGDENIFSYIIGFWNALLTITLRRAYRIKKRVFYLIKPIFFSFQILVSVFYIYRFIYANALQLTSSPYNRVCVHTILIM